MTYEICTCRTHSGVLIFSAKLNLYLKEKGEWSWPARFPLLCLRTWSSLHVWSSLLLRLLSNGLPSFPGETVTSLLASAQSLITGTGHFWGTWSLCSKTSYLWFQYTCSLMIIRLIWANENIQVLSGSCVQTLVHPELPDGEREMVPDIMQIPRPSAWILRFVSVILGVHFENSPKGIVDHLSFLKDSQNGQTAHSYLSCISVQKTNQSF